jgi:hypothetical protein
MGSARGVVEQIIKLKGEDQASKTLKAFAGNMLKTSAVVGLAKSGFDAITGAIGAMGDAIAEAAAQSDRLDILKRDVKDLDKVLGDVRKKTTGLIPDAEIVKSAAMFKSFGLDVGQLDDALEQAAKTAARTGESMDHLADSLVRGIARESPAILDNLGIMVSLSEAADEAARSTGKMTDELTAQERKAGLLAVTLKKLKENNVNVKLTDQRASSIKRLSVAWSNLTANAKQFLADAAVGLIDFFTGASEETKTWGERIAKVHRDLPPMVAAVADAAAASMEHVAKTANATLNSLRTVSNAMAKLGQDQQAMQRAERKGAEAAVAAMNSGKAAIGQLMSQAARWQKINPGGVEVQRLTQQISEKRLSLEFNILAAAHRARVEELGRTKASQDRIAAEKGQIAADAAAKKADKGAKRFKKGREGAALDLTLHDAEDVGFAVGQIYGRAISAGMAAVDGAPSSKRAIEALDKARAAMKESTRLGLGIDKAPSETEQKGDAIRQAEAAGYISALEATALREQSILEFRKKQWGGLVEGLQGAASMMGESQDEAVQALGRGLQALDANFEAISKGGDGAIAASGAVAAAFIDDTKQQAVIMALFEGAAAIAAFASQNYVGGAMHLVSAGLYAAVAGGAGGSKGAGGARGTASRKPRTIAAPRDSGGGNTIININAPVIGGTAAEIGSTLRGFSDASDRAGVGARGAA